MEIPAPGDEGDNGGDEGGDEGGGDDQAPPPPAATGIGQVCDDQNPCPESAPVCLAFAQNATAGVCTAICGETPIPEGGQAEPPPPEMDTVCPTYSGSATAACVLGLQGEPGATTQEWGCAVLCGTYQTPNGPIELGECDGGLTCGKDQPNLCSP